MNTPLDITKSSGEELAEIIIQEFQVFTQSKNNIESIQRELARRKSLVKQETTTSP